MTNINSGTLITHNDSVTMQDYLDPGTVASSTALYFQPQFSAQSTGYVGGLQTVIWEIEA